MAIYNDRVITYESRYQSAVRRALTASGEFSISGQGYIDTAFPTRNHPTHFNRTVAQLNGEVSSDKPKPLARLQEGRVVFVNRDSPIIRAAQRSLERVIKTAVREAMRG
ncbi:MAG TPA: hypothetical protein VJI52_04710 [Candidatus Nanoarchaeia archaeon]|nr:hypothetical protein [Candidatus Nanoarchaeia archaeon]